MSAFRVRAATALSLSCVMAGVVYAQDREWRTYGGDLASTKYSSLEQISAENFSKLTIAWRWKSVDGFLSMTMPGGGEWWSNSKHIFELLEGEDPNRWRDSEPPYIRNFKATPLMVGGVLY